MTTVSNPDAPVPAPAPRSSVPGGPVFDGPAFDGPVFDGAELVGRVRAAGLARGLDAVGIGPAAPMRRALEALEQRKSVGLHAGMQFTYRNPARSTDPSRILPGARSLVVGALSYARQSPPPDGPGPATPQGRIARYAWSDYYGMLREALGAAAEVLTGEGWRCRVVVDDNALVDREAAVLAGLGWYGKNANVLLSELGSWVVLGSLVTDAPLPTSEPVADGCGSCRRCLVSCPTGALVAPGVVDARRCLAWLVQAEGVFPVEHRVALGDRIYGCDDCQQVCPVNLRLERSAPLPPAEAGAQVVVDLLDLLSATDEELLARHGQWYIARRQPRHLRRNALVALANAADPGDVRVAEALRQALDHDDPLVRAHAVWASVRLGRRDLIAGMDDSDPAVAAELAGVDAIAVRPAEARFALREH
jgi:epoxyqueuosine reductase